MYQRPSVRGRIEWGAHIEQRYAEKEKEEGRDEKVGKENIESKGKANGRGRILRKGRDRGKGGTENGGREGK